MIGMGRRTAREQVAHLLCELFLRLNGVGLVQEDGYEMPATQADFGERLRTPDRARQSHASGVEA